MTKWLLEKSKKYLFQEDLIGYCDKCGEFIGTSSENEYYHTFHCLGTLEGQKELEDSKKRLEDNLNRIIYIMQYETNLIEKLKVEL